MPKQIKIKVWFYTGYVSVNAKEEVILEVPESFTPEQIERYCGEYFQAWLVNQFDAGWQQIEEEGDDE